MPLAATFIHDYLYLSTISFPNGVSANPASLKCCMPKGNPIIVILSKMPKARCERLIHIPPKNIQRIFINILRQPPESGQLLTSFEGLQTKRDTDNRYHHQKTGYQILNSRKYASKQEPQEIHKQIHTFNILIL